MLMSVEKLEESREITIIEPHADDAWLGLGGFMIMNPDISFTVITICKNEETNRSKFLEAALPNIRNISVFLFFP